MKTNKKLALVCVVVMTVAAFLAADTIAVFATTVQKNIYTTDDIVYSSFITATATAKGEYHGTNYTNSTGTMQVGIVNSSYSSMGYVNVAPGDTQTRETTMNLTSGNAYAMRLRGYGRVTGKGRVTIP